MHKSRFLLKVMLLQLMAMSPSVHSLTHCVTNDVELADVLIIAVNNTDDNTIKIAAGNYTAPPLGFSYAHSDNRKIEISGGWTEDNGNLCGEKLAETAYSTTLVGGGPGRIFYISTGGDITVSDLNFINSTISGTGLGGALRIQTAGGDTLVERNSFINNQAFDTSAFLALGFGKLSFRNNLLLANISTNTPYPNTVYIQTDQTYMTNNTILNNIGGLFISTLDQQKALIANNVLWSNEVFDLGLSSIGDTEIHLYNNDINFQVGAIPTITFNNFSLDPRFIGSTQVPAWGSPLINQGVEPSATPPIPFEQDWNPGYLDFAGNDRVRNGQIDIGSFEAPTPPDLIFENGFAPI